MEKAMKGWIKIQFKPIENEKKLADLIKKLYKTHEVIFIDRGTLHIKKK